MHLDKFDLNLLVALNALLTEQHVTRAADKLCVSQPAMSAALARLRIYFDDPLLQKVGPRLELTPRATELAGEVRELIFKIRTTLRNEPSFDPASGDRDFRLAMSDYVASVFMPALARKLLETAPGVRVHIEPLSPDGLTKVDHGLIDFCITVKERDHAENVDTVEPLSRDALFSDEFVLIADKSNRTAASATDPNDFCRLPYIAVRFANTVISVAETSIHEQGLPLRPAMIVPSFTAAACLVPGTGMTSFIPRRLAELLGPALGLAVLPAPISLKRLHETLVWHGRNDADPAHVWFRSILHETAEELRHSRRVAPLPDTRNVLPFMPANQLQG